MATVGFKGLILIPVAHHT